MTDLELHTQHFWTAASFRRRAPDRDQTYVRKVLGNVAINSTGRLHKRAVAILREIDSVSDNEPGGGSSRA